MTVFHRDFSPRDIWKHELNMRRQNFTHDAEIGFIAGVLVVLCVVLVWL